MTSAGSARPHHGRRCPVAPGWRIVPHVKPPTSKPPARDKGGEIVELSRFRAELGRGRRVRRADLLLDARDPAAAIRALPGDEFYYVLHEMGFPDALEVLRNGSPEQVQTALDFALWDRDVLAPAEVEEWLGALVEVPPAVLGRWCQRLDVELLALLLRRRTRVYDLSQEEPPDDPEGSLWTTPDRLFAIELLGDEGQQRITGRLLDGLYRFDHNWMRRVLVGLGSELDAELEELAFRWRSGRMADLGFADYFEALEVYREVDPATVRLGDQPVPRVRPLIDDADDEEGDRRAYLRVPTALAERLASGSPFAQAVAGIGDKDELANLQAALVTLSNHVLAADRVRPGDDGETAAVLSRMTATLDVAIEFLARGRSEDAVRAVRTVPLTRLFQLGVSLVGKVRRLALTLRKGTPFARLGPAVDLFEPDDRVVLDAVTRLRPLFPRLLDDPPAAGDRPFASLADIARATGAVERAGAALSLLFALGVRPEDLEKPKTLGDLDPAAIDAALLGRTLLARRWLGGPPASLGPIDDRDRTKLMHHLKRSSDDHDYKQESLKELIAQVATFWPGGGLPPAATAVVSRWFEELVSGEPVLGTPALGPR